MEIAAELRRSKFDMEENITRIFDGLDGGMNSGEAWRRIRAVYSGLRYLVVLAEQLEEKDDEK